MKERTTRGMTPIVIDAAAAHRDGIVEYQEDGMVVFRHPELVELGLPSPTVVPPRRQYPAIRATFEDLKNALWSRDGAGRDKLSELLDEEYRAYEESSLQAYVSGSWEPDYGTYVFDHRSAELYLVAPKLWHRLALELGASSLDSDLGSGLPTGGSVRRLEDVVVGFAGLGAGAAMLEGWLRRARPDQVKIADPGWVEATSLDRGDRLSIRDLVSSRGDRYDVRNPFETLRVARAQSVAYEQSLVDPYLEVFTSTDLESAAEMERFLLGDGQGEPPIQLLVAALEDGDAQSRLCSLAREHGIEVVTGRVPALETAPSARDSLESLVA